MYTPLWFGEENGFQSQKTLKHKNTMEKIAVSIDQSNRPSNYSMNIVNRDLTPIRVKVAKDHVGEGGKIKLGYTQNKGKSPFPFIVLETEIGKVKLFGENAENIAEEPMEWFKDSEGNIVSALSVTDNVLAYHAELVQPEVAEAETAEA